MSADSRYGICFGNSGLCCSVEPLLPEVEGSRAVEPRCEIGQSLLYCMKHPMEPGDATPAHERPLFEKKLRRKWAEHIAELYPDLLWSQNVMQRVAAMKEARREAAERKRLQVKDLDVRLHRISCISDCSLGGNVEQRVGRLLCQICSSHQIFLGSPAGSICCWSILYC